MHQLMSDEAPTERYVCPPEHKHAETMTCYTGHGCRCAPCSTRMNEYSVRRHAANTAKATTADPVLSVRVSGGDVPTAMYRALLPIAEKHRRSMFALLIELARRQLIGNATAPTVSDDEVADDDIRQPTAIARQIIALWAEDRSGAEIARTLGCSQSAVSGVLIRHNLPAKRNGRPRKDRA